MNTRTTTIASFFSVAMAAMLLGALVQEIRRPEPALARESDPVAMPALALPAAGQGAPFGLDTFREISRRVNAGIVNISTSKVTRRQRDPFREFFGDDMMDRFFGPRDRGQGGRERQTSLGSGFVIDREGYILTNRHVVDDADQISVTFSTQRPGDRPFEAKLVGKDARTDVALLKIEPRGELTVVPLGDSDATEVGDWVMAIGNPFGLGGNSVTVGVVSFKGRPLNLNERQQGTPIDMIQTDASINPGNSGGPLLNTRGEVIGINTMIVTSGLSQSAGVGFAVPVNVAKEILPQLRDTGKVVRGWLGVQIVPVTDDAAKTFGLEDRRGAAIVDVTEGSPADKAGLKPEDVVVGVDGRRVEDNNDLSSYVAGKAPGTSVNLRVLRQGAEQAITVRLGTFPDEGDARVVAAAETRGQLGMTLRDMTAELAEHLELPRGSRGVVVTEVEPGEPADDAGLRQGDVILRVNGTRVESVTEFDRALEAVRGDGLARLLVRRGSGNFFVILRFK